MKHFMVSMLFLTMTLSCFSQKGFGIDGSISAGYNGSDQIYSLLLEGRIQWNDYFSTNLGLSLWNSGWQDSWKYDDPDSNNSTYFRLSDSQTIPAAQLGLRGQVPVFKIGNRQVKLFAEPKLFFMPFSARTVNLNEEYFTRETTGSGDEIYTRTGETDNTSMKSDCNPRLWGGIHGGLSMEIIENVDLDVSYGYTNMDLFKDLRGLKINNFSLDEHGLPDAGIQLINISILVHYDIN